MLALAIAALLAALPLDPVGAAQGKRKSARPQLAPLPKVEFDPGRHTATPQELEEIERLIAELVEIDRPDYGLSSTLSGVQFAALAETDTFSAGLIGIDHGIATHPALRRLVEFGPKALPALLEALDDPTPTQLEFVHDWGHGSMWSAREVPTNPLNPFESAARVQFEWLAQCMDTLTAEKEGLDQHVVARGDVAFAILGQILGRDYESVRYQPSGNVVVNSPVRTPEITAALRAMWGSDDPARRLLDSLLHDYCTRGGVTDRGGPYDHQYPAALRLSYYFPEETRDFLVARLDGLDVDPVPWQSPGFEKAWREEDAANGCSAVELINALANSRDPAVLKAIRRAVERSTGIRFLVAALRPAFGKAEPAFLAERIAAFLESWPRFEMSPYGDEFNVLRGAAPCVPGRAAELFELWLDHETVECRTIALRALRGLEPRPELAVAVLGPLLSHRSDTGETYAEGNDRRPLRVCDAAAFVIAQHVAGVDFALEGDRENLDRQIAALREQLTARGFSVPERGASKPR
jgi:hypothetical protein